jgi:hypothetical protein
MIKRTIKGFKRLKKKYYTPKVKKTLSNVGKTLVAAERGSNSLVGDSDPYGTAGMFSNQFSNKSDVRARNDSFSDNNSFLMGFQQRQPVMKAPVKRKVTRTRVVYRTAPVRRKVKVIYRTAPRRRKATKTAQPQPSGPFGNFQY